MKNHSIIWLLCTLLNSSGFAQWTEDFSDGDFTNNPTWQGNASQWLITTTKALQLNSTGTDTAYLFTNHANDFNVIWSFKVSTGFSPSGSNLVRVYLGADTFAKAIKTKGYFIAWGETGSLDSYDLYRQDGATIVKILDGIDGRANFSTNIVDFQIIRTQAHEWKVYSKNSNETSFILEGIIKDSTYYNSKYFGFWPKFTSTNATKFTFDDLSISTLEQDVSKPRVFNFQLLSDSSVRIQFSEPISSATAILSNFKILSPAVLLKKLIVNPDNLSSVELIFNQALPEDTLNILVQGIADRAGNGIKDTLLSLFYEPPYSPKYLDVIVSEFFPDPIPTIGLPGVEYIEIYNTTKKPILLNNWKISDGSTTITFPNDTIEANSFALLISKSDTGLFADFKVKKILFSALPSLNNTSDQIKITAYNGLKVDSIQYSLSWYKDKSKEGGGYSIECIDVKSLCRNSSVFKGSEDNLGGTPGTSNSVVVSNFDTIKLKIDTIQIHKNTLSITFNKSIENSIDTRNFTFSSNSLPASLRIDSIVSEYGQTFHVFLSNYEYNTNYQVKVNALKTCSNNAEQSVEGGFSFFRNEIPRGLIVFNEIFPDPSPQIALPLSEFVELKNISTDSINLKGITYADPLSSYTFTDDIWLAPNALLVLVNQNEKANFTSYDSSKILGISPWPGLNNASDSIWLKNELGDTIANLFYKDSWYKDADKKSGGFTLERIYSACNCDTIFNYKASIDNSGGTIAKENSVYSSSIPIPSINTISVPSPTQIQVNFINADFVQSIGSQIKIAELRVDSSLFKDGLYTLYLLDSLKPNQEYDLNINSIKICGIDTNIGCSKKFSYHLNILNAQDIIFSEIMIDPSPSIGLPELEYIEIYNTADTLIHTLGLSLQLANDRYALPDKILLPQTYYVVTESINCGLFTDSTKCIGIPGLKSLNNTRATLKILDEQLNPIENLNYHQNWHSSTAAKNGGYSLERVNLKDTCNQKYNWTSSVHALGGTPLMQNSVFSNNDIPLRTKIFSYIKPNRVMLSLNKSIENDSLSLAQKISLIGSNLVLDSISIQDSVLNMYFNPEPQLGSTLKVDIDGIETCYTTNQAFEADFPIPYLPQKGDIKITEVLFEPYTDGVEFIELYNASPYFFDMNALYISDNAFSENGTTYQISSTSNIWLPKTYKVLSLDSTKVQQFYHYGSGTFINMPKMPSLNNDEDQVFLLNEQMMELESLSYTDDMHLPLLNLTQGVSLERVNIESDVNMPGNWYSAASSVGFATPGLENSQQKSATNTENKVLQLSPSVFSPDGDGYDDLLQVSISDAAQGKLIDIIIYDEHGYTMTQIAHKEIAGAKSVFVWNGLTYQNQELPVGPYFVQAKVFELDGSFKAYYAPVILARKFNR